MLMLAEKDCCHFTIDRDCGKGIGEIFKQPHKG